MKIPRANVWVSDRAGTKTYLCNSWIQGPSKALQYYSYYSKAAYVYFQVREETGNCAAHLTLS